MNKLIFLIIILTLFSCEKVKTDTSLKKDEKIINNDKYSTRFCVKNKKLWAESFLGKQAPKFAVEGWVSAKPEFKNKFILIDFWGTHCPQCKKAIPELNKISKKYKDKLIVIGIATATKNMIKSMKYPSIEYYSAYDTHGVLKNRYGVRGIPHIVIIAPDNTVVWEGYPFLGNDLLTLEKVGKIINQ
jgi:thiol-disulfide isomerase/thioredoxin